MHEREPVTQTMKASQVWQEWDRLLNEVSSGDQRVLVEKGGVPVAALVSTKDLERLKRFEIERAERFRPLEEFGAAFKDESPEDIEREVARAVAEARAEIRREQQGDTDQP